MQNLLEIQNALRSAPDQQLMSLMQGANSSVPQWAVASEMNSRKEMRDEQTRQEGLGQPTVLQQLTGTAPAPTPQTNVAGMPQGVASGMAQSMAPKTDVAQNTGIASVAPVATMASGGILKMGLGGDLDAQFILTDIPELGIRAGQFVKVSTETLEGLNNTLPEVMAKHGDKVASVQSYIDDGYRGLASAAREGDALIPTRVKKYVESTSPVPEVAAPVEVPAAITNFSPMGIPVDSPTLSPETMALAPTSPQGIEVLDIAKDARPATNTPRRMSTPVGLPALAAAGDADMRGEAPVVNTSTLSEKELRKQADNRNEAGRARFELMRALEATNSKGQPGGTLGKRYAESGDDLRMVDAQRYIESLIKGDPYSGELSPSQTARNQKTLSDTLRREEVARQRADITEAGKIAQDAADTREAYSVPLESDAVETVSAGEIKPNPFAVSKAPFNATSDEAAKESVSTAGEPGTELAETAGRPASNAQLEAFTDAAALRNEALTVPTKSEKPEVFDPLKGLFMYQALPENNAPKTDAETIRQRINELKTPEEKAATLTMLNNRFIDAEQEVKRLKEKYERVRIAEKSGTGNYAIDEKAGIGLGAGNLGAVKKELIAAKDNFNSLYKNIGRIIPASGFGGDFATEGYFGKDTVNALNKLKADDLQAEAVADVAKATTAEPDLTAQTAGAEDYLRRQRENKELDAEAVLDAERAAGLTAGKNAFVAPSSADPTSNAALTAKLVEQMQIKDAPVSDGTRLDSYLNAAGQQGRAIGAAANYTPKPNLPSYEAQLDGKFDKRVIEMRELADGIASGEYTGNGLKIAQDRIKYLNSVMEATGGAETLFEYLNDGAKQVVQKIIAPAAVDMTDFVLGGGAQVALPEALGGGVDNTAATQDYLDILQRETDGKPNIPTKPSVLESNSILDAMITNDAQTKAGSAANVDNSLGALITDGKAQIGAVPGQILTPELNDKLAAGLETVVQNRTKEISEDGALINKMWGESEFQPETNVESQIVNAEGLTAAEQLEKDNKSAEDFYNNLPLLDQSVKNGNVVTPATRTGIATINPMDNRASDSPSSYEQKLLDILDKREKSADQDKWLGLAEMGMRLMASSNPNMLSAIGEAGLGASQTFLGNKRKAEAQEMDILTKLSALESRKQIADDANRTRLQAAGISASGRSPAGMVTNKVRLSETAKQIKAVQEALGGYQGSNLSSTQAQEKSKLEDQLKTLNAEYTSLYNNQGSILGNALAEANTPVDLSK